MSQGEKIISFRHQTVTETRYVPRMNQKLDGKTMNVQTKEKHTEAQRRATAIDQAAEVLRQGFPHLASPESGSLTGALAAISVSQNIPNVSHKPALAHASFAIPYFIDNKGDTYICMVQTSYPADKPAPNYALLGGLTELDHHFSPSGKKSTIRGETPAEGAVREMREESLDDKGKPVLDIDPDRLELLDSNINYKYGQQTQDIGSTAYRVRLNQQEFDAFAEHALQSNIDSDYQHATYKNSNHEINCSEILLLKDAINLPEESFQHPRSLENIQTLGKKLGLTPEKEFQTIHVR